MTSPALLITLTCSLFISTFSLSFLSSTSSPPNENQRYIQSIADLLHIYNTTSKQDDNDIQSKFDITDFLFHLQQNKNPYPFKEPERHCAAMLETQCGGNNGLIYCCEGGSNHVCCHKSTACCPAFTTCCGKYCCQSGDECRIDGCYRWERKTYFIPVGLICSAFIWYFKACCGGSKATGQEEEGLARNESEMLATI